MNASPVRLLQPRRLEAVRRSGLLDTGAEEPFDRLTRLACDLLDAPFGFVTVVDDRRSFWKSCVGTTASELADRQNTVGESFCQYVIEADDAVIIGDARLNPMTRDNPSIASMGVIAWAGFPVRSPDGEVLGTFCVVDGRPREWTAQQVRTLEVLAHAASGEVALRIKADEASRLALETRVLAETLQESLLPRELPGIPGLDTAAVYVAGGEGGEVLGDFYDVVYTPGGWAVFVGDVSGKGARAARTTALARYTLRASALRHTSPGVVLTELNAALRQWFAETSTTGFATVAYALVRPRGDDVAVRLCTAGHPPALLVRANGDVEQFGLPGTLLGGFARVTLRIDETVLRPGDTMLLYTDGITEARDRSRAMLDDVGLRAILGRATTATAAELVESVRDQALAYSDGSIRDDIAMVAIRVPPDFSASRSRSV
ncbi:histidine kinase [Asanoa ishikariensis]|uniref:Serine phosphatase RsbU, regulator of sigma subunit n=1 Tax=Asanoa ishikariensis TaxID=137265 RepID=A0A1H3RST2_9ACTN|nr:GAF domain-containing SpoIIE family protein phosphatase [Asanoa ishikariensis]GIF66869.1 histidine kinase [Asanoa ishikariensis]SDZ28752.1 Serine phosphatase RsbU, regulator of sigma subunit [Asanoa ishikariensis]